MKLLSILCAAAATLFVLICAGETAGERPTSTMENTGVSSEMLKEGKELFAQNCNICHPNGGNIINPEKSLQKESLKKNGITTAEDILHIIRNPGPGMRKFSRDRLSDEDALKIAEYILNTY